MIDTDVLAIYSEMREMRDEEGRGRMVQAVDDTLLLIVSVGLMDWCLIKLKIAITIAIITDLD